MITGKGWGLGWKLLSALSLGVALVSSCGTGTDKVWLDANGSEAEEQQAGHLRLPLVTAQDAYRLRSAVFTIVNRAGSRTLTLDTSTTPDAAELEAELLQDTYDITLRDGWVLEHVVGADTPEGGAPVPVRAALITPNPSQFEVKNGADTELVYSFTTDDGVVTLGRGGVSISVNVAPTASLTACDLLDRSSCGAGQTCLLADAGGKTFCGAPGALEVGSPCSSEQCVAGAQCLYLDAEHPNAGVCTRFCRTTSAFCGCQGLSFDAGVGICTDPTRGASFSHAFQANIASAEACTEWNSFRSDLRDGDFGRVTMANNLGRALECDDPAAATQICRALSNGQFVNVPCGGHSWSVSGCGGAPELSVDISPCNCSSFGSTVRPCNGSEWGGVGTGTCSFLSPVSQTIEVRCEGGSPVCGDNLITPPEVCDGTALPAGTPAGSTCNSTCTTIFVATPTTCGNNILQPPEVCDGVAFPAGTPAGSTCNATCTQVIPPTVCGNNVIQPPEVCDGTALPAGTPAGSVCNANCTQVIPRQVCGDNFIQPPEVCDGTALPAGTPAGSVCNANCSSIIAPNACSTCIDTSCPLKKRVVQAPDNFAVVAPVLDCVLGPNWAAFGHIPVTSPPLCSTSDLLTCYCGTFNAEGCTNATPNEVNGSCKNEIIAGTGCSTSQCVGTSLLDPANATGKAMQFAQCEADFCWDECMD